MRITYKKAGVDIKEAESFIKGIKLNDFSKVGAFGSLFSLKPFLKKYRDPLLVSSTDGVGTKLKIAQYANIHDTVGIDLVAMNVNDIVCAGAKPLFFLDYIAYGKVDTKTLTAVIRGIKKGLGEAECLLLGGETAQMPGMYKKDEYDLAGFCVGIAEGSKVIDGKNIKERDVVIGLASSGLHSNGFSLARKVFIKNKMKKYAKELLTPTRIYTKPILSLLSASSVLSKAVKGIAHVTGGAFYNKVVKVLPAGLGMAIDKKSWQPPKIFKVIQKNANLDTKEMYSVFNMGIGMILVVERRAQNRILTHLNKFCDSYVIGEVVKSKERMILA